MPQVVHAPFAVAIRKGKAMSQETFLVAYDGQDRSPVDVAAAWGKKQGARLLIVHVLEWSPYTFLTPEELAARHKHRQEEIERATGAVLRPILDYSRQKGVEVEGELRHGNVVDAICSIASEENASAIFCGRSGKFGTRVFGSAASGLIQSSGIPIVVIP